jgi:Mrp family chromosome partitioning ATPase/capsular polysaccharide biosynthesis protein
VEGQGSAGIDVRHYLAVVRRHILLIAALTVVLGVAAYAYSASKTPMYEASAQLLYAPQVNVSDPLSTAYTDQTTEELQMQSAVTIITGPDVDKLVMAQIGNPGVLPDYSVSAAVTTSDTQASTPVDNGVAVTVDSSNAQWAAKLANAYANQFVAYSADSDRKRLVAAEAVVSAQLTKAQPSSYDYTLLTQDLHDLKILAATTTGDFSMAVPAYAPGAPYSPRSKRSAAMGAVLGLVLGIGFSFLREKLDTRLHSHHEVSQITNMPVIGRVAKIPAEALAKGQLVVMSEADGRAAESLRVLRSNLQFASLGEENRVLMVMSAQKGEGKSLLTSNLAASLALAGKNVMLVDADLRRPRIHSIFGTSNAHGVSSVIAGFCSLDDALQTYNLGGPKVVTMGGNGQEPQGMGVDGLSRLTLLTSGPMPPNPGEMVASRRFAALIRELADKGFDYVLVDSPAFMAVGDAAALAAVADAIVLLVNMKMMNKPMLEEAREFLKPLPPTKLGVVTVMDSVGKGERYHYYTHSA